MNLVSTAHSRLARLRALLHRYGDVLWWLHSLWALLVGVAVMWLGSHHYGLLRIAIFQIAFIWVASLVVPTLVNRPPESSKWANRARLVINYFSRNFYQQLLFFLLPIYYASASLSWNLLFVGFLGLSALLSTFDVVYDRHLSVRRGVMAIFFAFNLFACINAMLPIVWSISNAVAMWMSAALALVAFITILFGLRKARSRTAWPIVALSAIVLFVTVEFARPLIPPAPLRVVSATFGLDVNRRDMRVTRPVESVEPGFAGRLYVITAVYAPMGLEDRVGHRWYVNDELVWASSFHDLRGGRKEGFRLWTSLQMSKLPAGRVRVDVETEAGQLVGRSELRVETARAPGDIYLPVPF